MFFANTCERFSLPAVFFGVRFQGVKRLFPSQTAWDKMRRFCWPAR
jgi:hypothetical protein